MSHEICQRMVFYRLEGRIWLRILAVRCNEISDSSMELSKRTCVCVCVHVEEMLIADY